MRTHAATGTLEANPIQQKPKVSCETIPALPVVAPVERLPELVHTVHPISGSIADSIKGKCRHLYRESITKNTGALESIAMHGSEFPGTGHVKDLIAAWESRVPSLRTSEKAQGTDIPENQSSTMSICPDMESGDPSLQPLKRGDRKSVV